MPCECGSNEECKCEDNLDFHTKMLEEEELLNISMRESIKQKKERTQ